MAHSNAYHAGMATAQDAVATLEHLLSSPETNDFMFEMLAAAFDVLHSIEPREMPQMPVLTRAANRPPILDSDYTAARRRHQFYVLSTDQEPIRAARLG